MARSKRSVANGHGREAETGRVIKEILTPPKLEEWNNNNIWKRYKTFKYHAETEMFGQGKYVFIESDQPDLKSKQGKTAGSEQWIGLIKDIRALDGANVFITVIWMYTSIAQLQSEGIKGIPRALEGNEIFLSEREDVISVHAVNDHAKVYSYDELDPWQEAIPSDAIFHRATVKQTATAEDPKANKGKRKRVVDPGPSRRIEYTRQPTCFCKKRYEPLPLGKDPMIFCPRPACLRWYHMSCCRSRPHLLKRSSPELLQERIESGLELLAGRAEKIDEVPSSASRRSTPSKTKIPDMITIAAGSSITRGTDEVDGIVGNTRQVLLARQIVNDPKNSAVADRIASWQEEFGDEESKASDDEMVICCAGAECGQAI